MESEFLISVSYSFNVINYIGGGWTKFEKGVAGKMEGLGPVCQLIFLTAKYKRRYTENYLYKKRKIPLSID